jgi:hypothetical protein
MQHCSLCSKHESHRILEERTCEDVFKGVKPKIGNLRIFGFSVYIHVPKEKRINL